MAAWDAALQRPGIFRYGTIHFRFRPGAGLGRDKRLDEPSQARALICLRRFGERLRGLGPHTVRAIGTNTLRVARNASGFLNQAEAARRRCRSSSTTKFRLLLGTRGKGCAGSSPIGVRTGFAHDWRAGAEPCARGISGPGRETA